MVVEPSAKVQPPFTLGVHIGMLADQPQAAWLIVRGFTDKDDPRYLSLHQEL